MYPDQSRIFHSVHSTKTRRVFTGSSSSEFLFHHHLTEFFPLQSKRLFGIISLIWKTQPKEHFYKQITHAQYFWNFCWFFFLRIKSVWRTWATEMLFIVLWIWHTLDHFFCDKNWVIISLNIKIVWKFMSEGVNEYWVKYQYTYILSFYMRIILKPYSIISICVCHKIAGQLKHYYL